MAGRVVHARRGERAAYRPLESPIARSSDPQEVVRGLLDIAPFPVLYVADLDAIRGIGSHRDTVQGLRQGHPDLALWVDAGFRSVGELRAWTIPGVVPVIGSESVSSLDALQEMLAAFPEALLSLDSRGDARLGPPELFAEPWRWPRTVIVMTLERVGSGAGPADERIQSVLGAVGERRIVAAGGVRDTRDLDRLEARGAYAVLVASAIHDGSLDRAALNRFVGC